MFFFFFCYCVFFFSITIQNYTRVLRPFYFYAVSPSFGASRGDRNGPTFGTTHARVSFVFQASKRKFENRVLANGIRHNRTPCLPRKQNSFFRKGSAFEKSSMTCPYACLRQNERTYHGRNTVFNDFHVKRHPYATTRTRRNVRDKPYSDTTGTFGIFSFYTPTSRHRNALNSKKRPKPVKPNTPTVPSKIILVSKQSYQFRRSSHPSGNSDLEIHPVSERFAGSLKTGITFIPDSVPNPHSFYLHSLALDKATSYFSKPHPPPPLFYSFTRSCYRSI